MRIDSSFPGPTASSSNEPQRVRTPQQTMDPSAGATAGQIQPGVASARVSATVAVPRTARGADTASISGGAPSISDLASAVHTAADVRHTKVQGLREALDAGTYQISPDRIAQSMLAQATSKLR